MLNTTEYLALHRLFAGVLGELVGGGVPVPESVQALIRSGGGALPPPAEEACRWLRLLDLCLTPPLFRTGIQKHSPDEETLAALVRYFVSKNAHGEADRDRLDWLLTYLFKRRAATGVAVGFGAVRESIQGWLHGVSYPPLSAASKSLLSEVAAAVQDAADLNSFEQLTESGLIHRGRELKESFKDEFFHPEVLPAVVNYNLVFGRRFEELFAEAARQAREFAVAIAEKDYRAAGEDLRKLSSALKEEKRKPSVRRAAASVAPAPTPTVSAPSDDPVERMKALGIDPVRQQARLKVMLGDIASFVQSAGRAVKHVPLPQSTLPLADWESDTFSADYPPDDHSSQAQFSRHITSAVAYIACMHEELALYREKRDTEYLWKPHYDALIYLLYQGQQQVLRLERFAEETKSHGLLEKADQVSRTTARLRDYLERVSEVF